MAAQAPVALAVVALVVIALVVVAIVRPGPAYAHASLVASDPSDQSTVESLPTSVTLTFDEPVESAHVAVLAPDGTDLTVGDAQSVDVRVEQPLAAGTLQGTYTVSFRVVSHDGHPVTDTLHFDVGHASEPAADEDGASAVVGGDSFISKHVASLTIAMAALTLALCLAILRAARTRREHTEP